MNRASGSLARKGLRNLLTNLLSNLSSKFKSIVLSTAAILTLAAIPGISAADTVANSVIGARGYDLTTFFTSEKPAHGTGHHVASVDGVDYLFTSEENKKTFLANPEKYLPAFGGYCAYGASIGKKFVADPDVYDIVDNKLYFNLDTKIRAIWAKDIAGNISTANNNWKTIASKKPSEL
ncbi:YHS domain-containing (seleno)protein [Undibacterium sp. TJN19]|uniref:YHS domain-containing (seleno)protein n=1 Tax=Undibacterium sp. TJN19 TaxID=3413055 RepID=UPI003BF0456C